MAVTSPRLLVTGASGQLGRLVIEAIRRRRPDARVAGMVRDPTAAAGLVAAGVQAVVADYARPDSLDAALAGVDRLLLISSNAVGARVAQHRNVVEAARRAGVTRLAYTSILHADTTPLALAADHRETEAVIRASGLPHAMLRNGWYTENVTAATPAILAHGAVVGSAGEGRISFAARADYAEAAAAVLTADEAGTRVYELAGDAGITKAELAAEIARQTGRPIVYRDLPRGEYETVLIGAGLPEAFARLVADSDVHARGGALHDAGRQLGTLIGRPTTPLAHVVAAALRAP